MATTTNFEDWLNDLDLEDEEVFALYEALKTRTSFDPWDVTTNSEKIFIKSNSGENVLMIASEKALDFFLSLIVKKYCEGFDDMESWYGYQRNIRNPKA